MTSEALEFQRLRYLGEFRKISFGKSLGPHGPFVLQTPLTPDWRKGGELNTCVHVGLWTVPLWGKVLGSRTPLLSLGFYECLIALGSLAVWVQIQFSLLIAM